MELQRLVKAGDRAYRKILFRMMDVGIIITTISATAASLASGATLIAQTFHVPTMIGSIIMLACVTVICIFGASLVRKNAMVMTVGILVIIAIILVMGLAKFCLTSLNYSKKDM